MIIRKAAGEDIDAIFFLYSRYMFDSSLLEMGECFVRKYLKIIMGSDNSVSLVAEQDGQIIGFIMAALDIKKMVLSLILDAGIIILAIKSVLRKPKIFFKIFDLLLYPLKSRLPKIKAEFLFIAISPEYRNKNIAAQLIKKVLYLMGQRGITGAKVCVLADNKKINQLLHKLGFRCAKIFNLFKKKTCLYHYDFENILKNETD